MIQRTEIGFYQNILFEQCSDRAAGTNIELKGDQSSYFFYFFKKMDREENCKAPMFVNFVLYAVTKKKTTDSM